MDHCRLSFFVILLVSVATNAARSENVPFDHSYDVTWGNDHVLVLDQGSEVQLSMDVQSGSGFGSKLSYGSGFFNIRVKIPDKDSAGVVTALYLTSNGNNHDELDFEFLGNKEGKPITLQTNVFVNGEGNREQRIHLWFDPTADFHAYKILWNQYQIVFYVDNIPIRVFKNNTNIGVKYATQPMKIEASLWDGDSWATDGGQTKTNWSKAPFKAHFQGFNIDGCPLLSQSSNNVGNCYGSNYWWNEKKYWKLDDDQKKRYEKMREKYMNYDYCDDKNRHSTTPIECRYNRL